jgi:hypothetical protein
VKIPTIAPEWRTKTVIDLCQSMREAQDWSALPILADALQDAGCPEGELLTELRGGAKGYARSAALVACAMSAESADAVQWLEHFTRNNDCPDFEPVVNAATGHHYENGKSDYPDEGGGYDSYYGSENDGEYLYFSGRDAHAAIPAEFWNYVEAATGTRIPGADRAQSFSFSCSC